MLNFFKTPLLWFLLIGAGLFVYDAYLNKENENTIAITKGDINKIKDQWRAQSGKEITPEMLDALIQEQVRERRLYREALALNLDKDDVIIQRRLAQKLRFLSEDIVDEKAVSEEDLLGYYRDHELRYVTSSTYSFQHIYFSGEDKNAMEKVSKVLDSLDVIDPASWESLGSPFILGRTFTRQSSKTLKNQFGQGFVKALVELAPKKWLGPIESVFGIHLVYLENIVPGQLPSFEEIQAQVLQDYRTDLRRTNFEAFLARLGEKYPVIIEETLETR